MKNSDFVLESKMVELTQNKTSKQPDRPDVERKLYFTLEINESHNQQNLLYMFYKMIVFKRYKYFQKSYQVGSVLQYSVYILLRWCMLLKIWFKNFVKPYHEEIPSKSWWMWQHHYFPKHFLLKSLSNY